MSSILTNSSAMVALQTLNSINGNLSKVQAEISTGKSVASAKDNAAVWAISQVMQSDVDGFEAISDSLSLGQSTVAVGRNGAEQITELLGQVKEKIVAAQGENVDRAKLQTDIESLTEQIKGISGAAQFNGQNLLSNSDTTAGSDAIDVLASLDRSSSGSISSSNISISKQDLDTTASDIDTGATASGAVGATTTATGAAAATLDLSAAVVAVGEGFSLEVTASGGALTGGDTAANNEIMYVAREGDTAADVAKGLKDSFNAYAASKDIGDDISATLNAAGTGIVFTSDTGLAADTITIDADTYATGDTTLGGGLSELSKIDVSSASGAASALSAIEGLTQTAIDAASEFGTAEKRLEIQNDFVSKLTDSLKSGIGSLVDANMEEASAKLQALQVQQQLGTQSLSIANRSPQSVLSLFR